MGIFKKSQIQLAMDLSDTIKSDADKLFECIKNDKKVYNHCASDNKIIFYSFILGSIIYKEKLSQKYNDDDVFKVVYTCVTSSYNQLGEQAMKIMIECTKQINAYIELDKNHGIDDMINAFIIFLLTSSIDDNEFIEKELDELLPKSSCYSSLYECLDKIVNNTPLNFDNYKIRKK